MPASLAWSSPPQTTTVFQVFGTKRKAAAVHEEDGDEMECGEAAGGSRVKRQCEWGMERGQGDDGSQQQMEEQTMQQSPSKTWCSQVQNQQVHRSPSPWPSMQPASATMPQHVQQTEHQQLQMQQQPLQPQEQQQQQLQQQQQQEQLQQQQQQEQLQQQQQQEQLQQQEQQPSPPQQQTQYIMNINDEVYSDLSAAMDSDYAPNTSQYYSESAAGTSTGLQRSRCYCRPSWDSLIALKPFVSDYY